MLVSRFFRSRLLVGGLLAAFALLVSPVPEFAQAKPASSAGGSLVGFIYDKDMKTPVPNAVVKIRNIDKATEYDSRPTDANGMYKITGIGEGRYILGVTATKGEYNFDYALALKGSETAKLSVALQEGGQTTGPDAKKKSFFTSPAGIVTMVIVAGVVLYALLAKKEEASPVR
ncbi:MAG TPA: carboxypeptidase-like regulatory domain-containing protein [Terriglobales bacterium]|nr:carboxypeptidase-like regulatory domain-containing protein [Terriglobales bacterium]